MSLNLPVYAVFVFVFFLFLCPSYLPWFEIFYRLLNTLADYSLKGQVSAPEDAVLLIHLRRDTSETLSSGQGQATAS